MEAVGGSTRIKVDARVLAATNKDRDQGRPVPRGPLLPPQRRSDFGSAAARAPGSRPPRGPFLMAMLAKEYGRCAKRFDAEAPETLRHYPWPGNVRELRNVVERLMIMAGGARRGARSAVPRSGERAGSVSGGRHRADSAAARCTGRFRASASCGR